MIHYIDCGPGLHQCRQPLPERHAAAGVLAPQHSGLQSPGRLPQTCGGQSRARYGSQPPSLPLLCCHALRNDTVAKVGNNRNRNCIYF